jgi:hypothetical protein
MNELDILLNGAAREEVLGQEARDQLDSGILVEDSRRRRPRYFDGRFLTARDLTRDQTYFLTRQADLGRIAGTGVAFGFDVQTVTNENGKLRITQGHGLTPSGEVVILRKDIIVDINDVPTSQRLNASLGLDRNARAPEYNATGVFVLALRPVEFTANAVASYPTSLTGERSLQDGDIVEATAVTLIPLEEGLSSEATREGRAVLARQIFLRDNDVEPAPQALALAVVALSGGDVVWLDRFLVRRDAMRDSPLTFGLGGRARREAFLRQYQDHLADVKRQRVGLDGRFAAQDYFRLLPPIGQLPENAVEIRNNDLVQWFFPPQIDVEVSLIPDDELSAVAEDALRQAPIDLQMQAEALEAVPVLVLVPVKRAAYASLVTALNGDAGRAPERRLTRATRPRPIDGLRALQLRRLTLPDAQQQSLDLAPWSDALSAASGPLLFVRRRQLAPSSFVVPRYGPLPANTPNTFATLSDALKKKLNDASEAARFDLLMARSTPAARQTVCDLLGSVVFTRPLFVHALLEELVARTRSRTTNSTDLFADIPASSIPGQLANGVGFRIRALTLFDAQQVTTEFSEPNLGTGLDALIAKRAEINQVNSQLTIAQSLRVPDIDRIARGLAADKLAIMADVLASYALQGNVFGVRDLAAQAPTASGTGGTGSTGGTGPATGLSVSTDQGEATAYKIITGAADTDFKTNLDAFLLKDGVDQRLVVTGLFMELLQEGWGFPVTGGTGSDPQANVKAALDAVNDWTPNAGPFTPPGGTAAPADGIRLRWADKQAIVQRYINVAGTPDFARATERFLAGGFTNMAAADFRVLGFTKVCDKLITWLLKKTPDQIAPFAATLKSNVTGRNVNQVKATITGLPA